ncbi:hypothetical protein CUC08_Gglean012680 [Alternaria sp. MG1]|nr:hypothetical protein CUC08_Gglean012680 [Alternaria sp. MG1]
MAAPLSPHPVYHDPIPTSRRNSSRKTIACLSRTASNVETARTVCPKDGDAFSYDPIHLRHWNCPQQLWDCLPKQVQSSLTDVQRAGAAVLTGFARLDQHFDSFEVDPKAAGDELLVHLDELPPPKFRTISNASSVFQSDSSSPLTTASTASQSGSASPTTPAFSGASGSQIMCPGSPICLGPPELSRSRERSFSTPLRSHDAKYAAELSHLRTEALPRLRHKSYKVDTEWQEAKRAKGALSSDDINAFENFWAEKKLLILSLNERGKRLASAAGLATTGLGWCAP